LTHASGICISVVPPTCSEKQSRAKNPDNKSEAVLTLVTKRD
jgi:hypothetical protein